MNYIGSKYKLSEFLLEGIESTLKKYKAKPLEKSIFCDMFAGSCAVGRLFKNQVKQIISNDKEFYSFVLAKNYIQNTQPLHRADELVSMLNDERQISTIESNLPNRITESRHSQDSNTDNVCARAQEEFTYPL